MSSKSIDKKFVKIEYEEEDHFDVKHCIIPFSELFPKPEVFIYDGTEKMSFRKRESLFRTILLQEFCDAVKRINDK